jgi:hypothetical protein
VDGQVKAHERKPSATTGRTKPKKATDSKRESTHTPAVAVARDERGHIQRSAAARHAFARHSGYPNGRHGYVLDHIVPLACGGADASSNMQWQTVADVTNRIKPCAY